MRLRAAEPGDWAAMTRFTEDEERLGDLVQPPRSAEGWRAEIRTRAEVGSAGERNSFVIEAVSTGEAVGNVGWRNADPTAGSFEYGIRIGAAYRRKGYASEAVTMLLRFMFAERRFHRCEAHILAYNEGSFALHRRLGFVEEGRLRDGVFAGGRYHDVVVMGMLADEFAEVHGMGTGMGTGTGTGTDMGTGIGSGS